LELIAADTDNFTGADLQSLISNAQLEAIHDILDNSGPAVSSASKALALGSFRIWHNEGLSGEKLLNPSQKSLIAKEVRVVSCC
jgi:hypothetical protein